MLRFSGLRTEQGTLLGNASNDLKNWTLVIFDRQGKLVNTLPTPARPAKGTIASWRKYGHR